MKAPRYLVRLVFMEKKYYLITPCVTIDSDTYAYSFPITKVDATASYDELLSVINEVMDRDCRFPDSAEWSWHNTTNGGLSVFFDNRKFKKDFGFFYASIIKTATSILMIERKADNSFVFQMWSSDGMTKEFVESPPNCPQNELREILAAALETSRNNRLNFSYPVLDAQ